VFELGISDCQHINVKQEGGEIVCQDCGLILEERLVSEDFSSHGEYFSESQRDYERRIRIDDSKALQDPIIREKYDRIRTLEKWFRDYQSDFAEQKKTIELLKSHNIGMNIDKVRYREIKNKYLRYNKHHRQTYQNMVIIFLAIIWLEIKDTTNVRIEEYIEASKELGHKINKKMLSNAMSKVTRTENMLKEKKDINELEKEIKNKIKIVFQKDLNIIPYEEVKECFQDITQFEKTKIEMQLTTNKILTQISYNQIQNLNYKAFAAGLIYYIGQTLPDKKIFTQSLVEKYSKFSSTTIRKKFHILKEILGDPQDFNL
jgi:transcription initiation factor TFIIIB Brf1 subunit/transcription initiation factor TFIIB